MRGQPTRSHAAPGFRCAHPGYNQSAMNDATTPSASYRVLARKYRPATFDDLIGQDAMVRTIANALRDPGAFRRPGSSPACAASARPRRRASWRGRSITNCPTARSPRRPSQCRCSASTAKRSWRAAISTSSRWTPPRITASTTCARSTTPSATRRSRRATRSISSTKCTCCPAPPSTRCSRRWKSRRRTPSSSSPPPKSAKCRSPCLSRCQRFDLRRVDAALLVKHLQGIAGKEAIEAEPEALALIARAAEGSVRDSLSLFDQAHRARSRPGARRGRAADARARRPHPRHRSVRGADARRYRRGAQGIARPIRFRRRSGDGARRSRRIHPFRHPGENRADSGRRRVADRSRAHARPRFRHQTLDAGLGAHLADAAQGHSPRSRPPAGRSMPPRWFWCASPMPPTCRRPTK